MRERPGLSAGDRLLAVTTLSFDIAALELFLPLITGAQIILATRESASDPRLLMQLLSKPEQTPSVMQATPATWRMLIESGWSNSRELKIFCGGEALPRQLANGLLQRGELWNMYGPTETTVWSATSRVEPGDLPVTIGPPIANTTFHVLDYARQLAPVGVPGELYIGGEGVARGYYNNPQLTAERFVPDPFAKHPRARLYRTGDLVRRRPDGSLEFLGRLDNQVKIRGFRIELGEIESVLSRHTHIRESVVAAQEHEPGLKRLVAYCVLDQPQASSSEELRAWIAASLPDYMIPSVFVFLPSLPHTPNGKVDRKALPHLDVLDLPDQKLFIAPRTPIETQLAKIVAEVLHLQTVSVHDSLFDLGADSIHLFQIIARAASHRLVISPQQVLRLRTVAALANEVETAQAGNEPHASATISPVSREQYQLNATPQTT